MFRRVRKLGHIRVVRLSSIRFLVSTTFLSVSVSFFLSSLFYLLHEPIEFFSLLGRGIFCRSFTPLATPHCEHTKLLRETFSLIATASLSLCTWPSFLARILQFKYSNVLLSCSYLCFPRFHIHLPSINHRAIPFIASSLYFSIFTSSSSGLHSLFSRLLLLLLAFVPVFRQTEGGGERKKSRIPGQRFQGSVTSLTNWLPRIPSAFLLFHRPSHDSPPTLYASSRKDT